MRPGNGGGARERQELVDHMKKIAIVCSTVLGVALLLLGTAPSASAYPELTCNVTVDHQQVHPGERFTATGEASGVDAANKTLPPSAFTWTFTWNGETQQRTGSTVSVTYKAPHVKRTRTITLTARSSSPAGDCVRHIDITVGRTAVSAPGGQGHGSSGAHQQGHGSGGLPGTGGPAFWILVAALVLLLGGGGAVAASRRRQG